MSSFSLSLQPTQLRLCLFLYPHPRISRTAADTDILLDINVGVDFSYRRRSVLVQYNGHVYAASIYCEPHGDQTITNNNFDGLFCLHFYGSKTHGSDRVDEDHKECEALALKYTW